MFLAFSAFIQSGNLSGNYAISKMNIKTISQLLLHVKRKNRDKNKFIQRHEHLAIFKKKKKHIHDSKLNFHRQFPQLHNS